MFLAYLIEVERARLSAGISFGKVIEQVDAAYRHVEIAFRNAPASRQNVGTALSTRVAVLAASSGWG